jgi:hypothetical protein
MLAQDSTSGPGAYHCVEPPTQDGISSWRLIKEHVGCEKHEQICFVWAEESNMLILMFNANFDVHTSTYLN